MAKKQKLIILIMILVFIGGGLFYWRQNQEIKGSPEDYIIKETEEGKIVENKKAGLTVRVPEGWQVEKIEIEEGSVIFYSPDAEGYRLNRIRAPLKNGCIAEIAVGYKKMSFVEIKAEIEELHKSLIMKSDEFEIIKMDGGSALKNTFDCIDLGSSTATYVPRGNKLYALSISAGPQDVERCSQEFDKFLETILID